MKEVWVRRRVSKASVTWVSKGMGMSIVKVLEGPGGGARVGVCCEGVVVVVRGLGVIVDGLELGMG